jgi:phosphatidylglycerol:prolipoprotein diacylglycerol transferase
MSLVTFDPPDFGWAMLAAVAATFWIWRRRFRASRDLTIIYFAALAGALIGAKLGFLAVEGARSWTEDDHWLRLASGKTILGALLGGFLCVEIAKKFVGYSLPTGDDFAVIVPAAVAFGRLSCVVHGCCLGVACPPAWYALRDGAGAWRWPAAPVEMLFNLLFEVLALILRARGHLRGQLFHLYLITYGIFRLWHEPLRATPKLAGGFGGYQALALLLIAVGLIGGWRRVISPAPPPSGTGRRSRSPGPASSPAAR